MKDAVCKFCGHRWRLGSIDEKCPSCNKFQTTCITDRSLHCNQCDHDWIQRRDKPPKKCPVCRSSDWNAPKHNRGSCVRCGHVWRIRSESPKKCPKCQSEHWNGVRVDVKCYRCGHEWTLREGRRPEDVKMCPSCKTKKWNEAPRIYACGKCGRMHLLRKNSREGKCPSCDPYGQVQQTICHLCGEVWEPESEDDGSLCPNCGASVIYNDNVSSMDIWSCDTFTLRYISEGGFGFVYLMKDHIPAAAMYFHQLCRMYKISAEHFIDAINNKTMEKQWEELADKMYRERDDCLCNVDYFRKRLNLDEADAKILATHFTGMGPGAIALRYGVSYEAVRDSFDRIMAAFADSGIVVDDTVFTENPFDFY